MHRSPDCIHRSAREKGKEDNIQSITDSYYSCFWRLPSVGSSIPCHNVTRRNEFASFRGMDLRIICGTVMPFKLKENTLQRTILWIELECLQSIEFSSSTSG
mmetsp:Transcript_23601/g.52325  ORF Transcript_23601/g.52325 Transcript_23601/m.52325 type:complete len:102 (+) Transcript_23601:91-396(+)